MIIYNTIDYTVIVTIGDQTYRMERDSELEVKIPAGEYYLRLHKVDRKDRLITTEYVSGGRHNRGTTYICMGMTALLDLRKATKLYIRETKEELVTISTEYYKKIVFDVIVENGELNHRQDGYIDSSVSKKMTRNFYKGLVFSIIGHVLLAIASGYMLSLLLDFLRENGGSEGDMVDLFFLILIPIVCVGLTVWDLSKFKQGDIFKEIPILPEKSYYDYL